MIEEEKLIMLLNEPIFHKIYQKDKNVSIEKREEALKLIYVNQKMIRRYKALMEARYMAIEDLKVDENIDFLIRHLEAVEEDCAERVLRTETQKDDLLERFHNRELRYSELKRDLKNISETTDGLNDKLNNLKDLKMRVDRVSKLVMQTLDRTEIVKALALQNKALKIECERVTRKEAEYLQKIDKLQKRLDQREQQIRFLREHK